MNLHRLMISTDYVPTSGGFAIIPAYRQSVQVIAWELIPRLDVNLHGLAINADYVSTSGGFAIIPAYRQSV
ncbi:MAG: hypothetical protein DRI57_03260 [Deltaproteobacteria bacterium]|nr:MAG: hypothetical protein DRI57_03260 [Deltaproteobacteria bacterium]